MNGAGFAMKNRMLVATAALLFGATAADAMTAHNFYVKAVALNQMGPAALLTDDFQRLSSEMKSASKALKAENEIAKSKGKALYCAPEKIDMTPNQLLAEFARIPTPRRKTITVRQAWREIAMRKYPC